MLNLQNQRVLVIGSRGMLGTELMLKLKELNIPCCGLDLPDYDCTNEDVLNYWFQSFKPTVVCNTAAYTKVDELVDNNEEKLKAIGANQFIPLRLVQFCRKMGNVKLIHISTDYVFCGYEGESEVIVDETYSTCPVNFYGITKACGEKAIINNTHEFTNYVILRTAWLYGKYGKNFVETILQKSKELQELKVVDDQIGCPTSTTVLINMILECIEQDIQKEIYHAVCNGYTSWFEFAQEIITQANIENVIINPCTTEEFPRKAIRPKFNAISNEKWKSARKYKPPHWKEALREYLINK